MLVFFIFEMDFSDRNLNGISLRLGGIFLFSDFKEIAAFLPQSRLNASDGGLEHRHRIRAFAPFSARKFSSSDFGAGGFVLANGFQADFSLHLENSGSDG